MTPYWSSTAAGLTLYHGDCLDVLPQFADGAFAHVITDPPYSEHVHAHGRKGTRCTSSGWGGAPIDAPRDLGFDALSDDVRSACAQHFVRLATRWLLVFSDTESAHLWQADLEDAGARYVRTQFWRKVGGAPQFTGDRPAVACEAIVTCHVYEGRMRWNGGGAQGFYDVPIVQPRPGPLRETRLHTTQKPLALMRQLVTRFADPGEAILDPFAGSGTTLVAAHEHGCAAVGIEQDEAVCEVAAKRLDALVRQGALFATPQAAAGGSDG